MSLIPEPLFAGIVARIPSCTVDVAPFECEFRWPFVFRRAQLQFRHQWPAFGGLRPLASRKPAARGPAVQAAAA